MIQASFASNISGFNFMDLSFWFILVLYFPIDQIFFLNRRHNFFDNLRVLPDSWSQIDKCGTGGLRVVANFIRKSPMRPFVASSYMYQWILERQSLFVRPSQKVLKAA